MFIEKRQVGKKTKYYLVHSYRVGKKVKKMRRFIGSDLTQEQLKKLVPIKEKQLLQRINARKKITNPFVGVIDEEELEVIKDLEQKAGFSVFHLSEEEWERFTQLFTYNTNAIEGSELTQKEVIEALEDKPIPDKPEEDISEAHGVDSAIDYIRKSNPGFSIKLIKKLHYMVFKDSKNFAGEFRKKGEEAVIKTRTGKIVHRGAPPEEIVSILNELVGWYKQNQKKYPPIVLASVVHNQFENIHPFADGNGRVGRLLLNLVLLKHGLPPVNIDLDRREKYYASLKEYEKEQNIRPTIELILSEYKALRKTLKKGDH